MQKKKKKRKNTYGKETKWLIPVLFTGIEISLFLLARIRTHARSSPHMSILFKSAHTNTMSGFMHPAVDVSTQNKLHNVIISDSYRRPTIISADTQVEWQEMCSEEEKRKSDSKSREKWKSHNSSEVGWHEWVSECEYVNAWACMHF